MTFRFVRRAVRSVFALTLAACAFASTHAQAAVAPAPVAAQSKGGMSQGIRVSGWWKIDVKNLDGSLVKHLEFENALTANGANALLQLMVVNQISGGMGVLASDGATGGACVRSGCIMRAENYGSGNSTACSQTYVCFDTLKLLLQGSTLTLTSNMVATQNGNISRVSTMLGTCPSSGNTPSGCITSAGPFGVEFTSFTLPNPLTLTANQIVQYSVVLSFS